jgi:hypothetical protein
MAALLSAWGQAGGLDRVAFRARFLPQMTSDAVTDKLREAARAAADGRTAADLRRASEAVAAAVQAVGLDRWSRFAAAAEGRIAAEAAKPANDGTPRITQAQWLELFTKPGVDLFAKPPVEATPRLMERIPRLSGKEAADDTPSWARGIPRRVGETPRDYAKRLMDDRFGEGKWGKKLPDFNKLKKWGGRAWRDPKSVLPLPTETVPQA